MNLSKVSEGRKKKIEIAKSAKEFGIKILNLNVRKFLEKIEKESKEDKEKKGEMPKKAEETKNQEKIKEEKK